MKRRRDYDDNENENEIIYGDKKYLSENIKTLYDYTYFDFVNAHNESNSINMY